MHPIVAITIDGTPVSAGFMARLISVTVHDKEGSRADTIDLEIEASGLAIPRKKAIITAAYGYAETGVEMLGLTADDIDFQFLPYKVKITGKSADMREGLKQHRTRHWDNKKIKDVVQAIAGENGLEAQVSDPIGNFEYPWLGQEGESDLHMLERLAQRHDAMVAVKNGKLLFLEEGSGESASGRELGELVITPPMVIQGTGHVKFHSREKHKKVRAGYHDRAQGARRYVEELSDDEGRPVYTLRHNYGNQAEAQRAAKSKAEDLKRNGDTTEVTIEGTTAARGGGPMTYEGIHPEIDGLPWIIEDAAHSFSKRQGYRTRISAKVPGAKGRANAGRRRSQSGSRGRRR